MNLRFLSQYKQVAKNINYGDNISGCTQLAMNRELKFYLVPAWMDFVGFLEQSVARWQKSPGSLVSIMRPGRPGMVINSECETKRVPSEYKKVTQVSKLIQQQSFFVWTALYDIDTSLCRRRI